MAWGVIEILWYLPAILMEYGFGIYLLHKSFGEFRTKYQLVNGAGILILVLAAVPYFFQSIKQLIDPGAILFWGACLALIYSIFWKAKPLEAFVLEVTYLMNLEILKLPVLTVRCLIDHHTSFEVNNSYRELPEAAWLILIMLLIIGIYEKYSLADALIKEMISKHKKTLLLILILDWCMVVYTLYAGMKSYTTEDLLLNMIVIICAALAFFYLIIFSSYQSMKAEKRMQQTVYHSLKRQYLELQRLYELSSQRAHDLKHELLYLSSQLQQNDISGAGESLEKYIQKIGSAEQKIWTGFSGIDFILSYKKTEIESKDIRYALELELHQLVISEEELVMILGNLLDNAMEAAGQCEKNERYIELKIKNLNEMLLIDMENSSRNLPKVENNRFISSKPDGAVHGFGIESVKRIVESYEGEISFDYDESRFEVKILL